MSWEYGEERLVQEPAAARMATHGWKSVLAFNEEDFGPNSLLGRDDKTQTILFRSVRKALKAINGDWITDAQVEEAIAKIATVEHGKSLLQQNFEMYELVREGVPVTDARYEQENPDAKRRAMLIDFAHPDSPNNEFLAVRELWIAAQGSLKRTDLLGFVNGLPLLFVELKKPAHPDKEGYDGNYKDYLVSIPELFRFNAMCVFSNGNETHVGALKSDWEFFGEWKRHAEDDPAPSTSLNKLIDGICPKAKFLDLVENFVLFDRNDGNMFKVLARNHQFLGVNKAYASYLKREEKGGKLGVFWHTQGSGKSYSMVFLARKILRKTGGSPSFLVVTDREELNDQIAGTFASCGCLGTAQPKTCMPGSGEKLKARLEGNDRFLFTLIQKFNSSTWTPIHPDHEVVIFSDEAHRTNNGILADNMLRFLPDASRIGFTGTPLQRGELTERQFGPYVSVYDFQRAVEDHATVPLFYHTKVNELGLKTPGLNEELLEAVEQEDLDPQDAQRVADAVKSKVMVFMAPERIKLIAKDFVRDYVSKWRSGKAMVVSVNKIAAYRTWKAVEEEWRSYADELDARLQNPVKTARMSAERLQELADKVAWMKETRMELVISHEQGDIEYFNKFGIDIRPYKEHVRHLDLEKDFKKAKDPFRVAFVCAMWLTGFDVPSLGTLYLDKPLKAHTLMQAIARANRVFEGKHNGVIIDYVGLIEYLGRALADFTGAATGGGSSRPLPKTEELLKHYEEAIEADKRLLAENGFRLKDLVDATDDTRAEKLLEAANSVATPDKVARAFVSVAHRMDDIGKFINAEDVSDSLRAKRNAIREIRSHLEHHREKAKGDIGALLAELQRTVGDHIENATRQVGNKLGTVEVDISKLDYSRLEKKVSEYRYKKLLLKDLTERAEDVIAKAMAYNPAATDFAQELKKIVDEYNYAHEKATIEKALQDILKLIKNLDEEGKKYEKEDFDNQKQYVVYQMLISDRKLSASDVKEVKSVAKELLKRLQVLTAGIDDWRNKNEAKALVRKEIRDTLFSLLPDDLNSDEARAAFEEKVYNYYYQLPDAA